MMLCGSSCEVRVIASDGAMNDDSGRKCFEMDRLARYERKAGSRSIEMSGKTLEKGVTTCQTESERR